MPFYEYQSETLKSSCQNCENVFEAHQSIKDSPLTSCPQCGSKVIKLISTFRHITTGKQVNQYNDVKGARYWRDKDGNRHRVTQSDGSSGSPTVSSKRKRTDEQVSALKKRERETLKRQRSAESYRRYVDRVRRTKRQ